MDINFENPTFPRKVEIVNNSEEPLEAHIKDLPLTQTGSAVYVSLTGGSLTSLQSVRPNSGNFNVFFDNILLLQSDGGFFALPLTTWVLNSTQSNLNSALASYKSAYSTLVSGVTSATLHYSKLSNGGVLTSEVYNLKD